MFYVLQPKANMLKSLICREVSGTDAIEQGIHFFPPHWHLSLSIRTFNKGGEQIK
jgi:hypothetical protein